MASWNFWNTPKTLKTTIEVPEPTADTVLTLPSGSQQLAGTVSPAFTGTPTINGSNAVSNATLRTELNASGVAPIYACRAWVNFNGTGTVAIRASGNVSSITDNGVGDYTVNFTTAMPDVNYCFSPGASEFTGATGNNNLVSHDPSTVLTTGIRLKSRQASTLIDAPMLAIAIFR